MELKFKYFVILQALDVLTTYIGLEYLHLREANIFASSLFQDYGLINALIGMKLIGLMIIYALFILYPANIKKITMNIYCIIFIVVVLNNSYQMIRVI